MTDYEQPACRQTQSLHTWNRRERDLCVSATISPLVEPTVLSSPPHQLRASSRHELCSTRWPAWCRGISSCHIKLLQPLHASRGRLGFEAPELIAVEVVVSKVKLSACCRSMHVYHTNESHPIHRICETAMKNRNWIRLDR